MIIILATDGEPHTHKATEYAISRSVERGASLHVLFVVSPRKRGAERRMRRGVTVLERLRGRCAQRRMKMVPVMESGRPEEKILDLAEKIDADEIILGKSNRRKMRRTIPERLVRSAPCTVTVVG